MLSADPIFLRHVHECGVNLDNNVTLVMFAKLSNIYP